MHQSTDKKKIVIYLIFLFILSTTTGKFLNQQENSSLRINKIYVAGLSNSKNLEIQKDLNNIFYRNIFLLSKEEINKIINKHNIIEEYNIRKIYPSTLNINIKPTKIVAKVTNNGNKLIVGANGKLISGEVNNKVLPHIFGEFNVKNFLELKKNVDRSKFNFTEFKSIYFFPSNRWDILMINNTLIKLPQKNMFQSLNLAHKIISNEEFKNKDIIDLRINSHLIIK
jgi:cell division protein FtsQ